MKGELDRGVVSDTIDKPTRDAIGSYINKYTRYDVAHLIVSDRSYDINTQRPYFSKTPAENLLKRGFACTRENIYC